MSLLPIATQTAPAKVIGAENPASAGSGDFAALVAMLVATASTTLPIEHHPAEAGEDFERPFPLPAEASAETAATFSLQEASTSPLGDMPAAAPARVVAAPPAPVADASPAAPAVEAVSAPVAELPPAGVVEVLPVPVADSAPASAAESFTATTSQPEAHAPAPKRTPAERPSDEFPQGEIGAEGQVLPPASVPSARPERPAPPASPAPAVMTVPADAPEQPRLDIPVPEKADGLPATKFSVASTSSTGSLNPVVSLVAPTRTEAPIPVDRPAAIPMAPPTVPEQIASAVVPLHGRGDGRHEVTLELRPDDLGTIRVEVSVEHQTVHLTLHAAEPATSRLLAASLPRVTGASAL